MSARDGTSEASFEGVAPRAPSIESRRPSFLFLLFLLGLAAVVIQEVVIHSAVVD